MDMNDKSLFCRPRAGDQTIFLFHVRFFVPQELCSSFFYTEGARADYQQVDFL